MGREAQVHAHVGSASGDVKAVLEAGELILRGAIRRRYPRDALAAVAVDGETLRFTAAGEAVALRLGAKQAEAWSRAIATPPPDLRTKLGLAKGGRALMIGACADASLAAAIRGVTTSSAADATLAIAMIADAGDLAAAQSAAGLLPLWTIYPKGRKAAFGDGAIRTALRAAGWRDAKSCAVSDDLTATLYRRS